jgi:trigger factor
MNIQVQEPEYCKVVVSYVADIENVKNKRAEVLEQYVNLARKRPIKGFRAGQAPANAIQHLYKKQIEAATKQELLAVAHDEILFETKIKPIGYPNVNNVQLNEELFQCELSFLKKPEFELKEYKGLEIPKPHQQYTQTQLVESNLEHLRRQHSEIVPYQEGEFIEIGDQVTMDVTVSATTINETTNDFDTAQTRAASLTKEGILYKLGQNYFDGFDDEILGMKAGEEREFKLSLGDCALSFKVSVHMGVKNVPCALDDELAIKVGLKNFSELRSYIEGMVTTQLQLKEKQDIQQQIVKRLLANNQFEVPHFLVEMEAQQIALENKTTFASLENESKQKVLGMASDRVKLSLIIDSIQQEEPDLVFSNDELLNVLKKRLEEQGQDVNKYLVENTKNGHLFGTIAKLRNEATMEWLQSNSKIIEE